MNGFIEVISNDHGTITRELTYFRVEDGQIVVDREIKTKVNRVKAKV